MTLFRLSVTSSIQFAAYMNLWLVCMFAMVVLKKEAMAVSGAAEEISFRAIVQTFLVQNLFLHLLVSSEYLTTVDVAQFTSTFSRRIIVVKFQLILALTQS
jgi:hypothetical protein